MKPKRARTFGEIIRQRRLTLEIGLRKLAESIGISATYLSKIERNELAPPAEERIIDLARALDLEADNLLTLARRLPPDVRTYIEDHPDEVTALIRLLRDRGEERVREQLRDMTERVPPTKRRA
jgi:transcriptional regulator with XRE-family HTH domain